MSIYKQGAANMFSLKRILISVAFALVFAGATLLGVSAQSGTATPPPPEGNEDCASCHPGFQMSWTIGAHGQATKDPIFITEWNKEGNPTACLTCHVTGYNPATGTWKADGVTCEACHKDSNGQHSKSPAKSPMSVDKTSNLCGSCHTDARFGWTDWEGSTHFKNGMTCTTCHDPHSATVKFSANGDASQLCITCHQEASMNFPYSKHSVNGVTCVNCHLEHLGNTTTNNVHQVPDHSFKASLTACNSCHTDQMHSVGNATSTNAKTGISAVAPTQDPGMEVKQSSLLPEPTPVNPLGYAGLAVLIGLAAGMLLAPWLERWYRLAMQKDDEVKHDGK
jgi:predicted CXXCH cytochrome family protein